MEWSGKEKEGVTIKKPERLYPGDQVGVIAPAGPPDSNELQKGVQRLQGLGLKVCVGRNVFKKQAYLAGCDQERVADLHEMFANPSIKAIFCARGGYGTARIVPYINYQLLSENPKVFWGYSDITYLHAAIQKYSGLATFHGPMVASDLGLKKYERNTLTSFNQLFVPTPVVYTPGTSPLTVLKEGIGTGRFVGGNLTLLADSLGTSYEVNTDQAILLIEDVDEPTYRIDAMLQHLKQAGKFEGLHGLVIGDFNLEKESLKQTSQLFSSFFSSFSFPVMKGFLLGHCQPHYGVPLGTRAYLDAKAKTLTIEPGVR